RARRGAAVRGVGARRPRAWHGCARKRRMERTLEVWPVPARRRTASRGRAVPVSRGPGGRAVMEYRDFEITFVGDSQVLVDSPEGEEQGRVRAAGELALEDRFVEGVRGIVRGAQRSGQA